MKGRTGILCHLLFAVPSALGNVVEASIGLGLSTGVISIIRGVAAGEERAGEEGASTLYESGQSNSWLE